MLQLIECVPNISEGLNPGVVQEIAAASESHGAHVLDIHSGTAVNRSVITFAGTPEGVKEGAFELIRKASELIDMRLHRGAHPRMGAVDVCPFVPLKGVTLEECADLARVLGRRVAEELNIPVYLYGEAADSPKRRSLSYLRKGEYEGLRDKISDPKTAPDFGKEFNPRFGALVTGARRILIAFNVDLETGGTLEQASWIASRLRESGYIEVAEGGKRIRRKGLLAECQAIGWMVERGKIQVSVNILNFEQTGMHAVFEAVKELALSIGTEAKACEIIGLCPLNAVIDTGRYYRNLRSECADWNNLPDDDFRGFYSAAADGLRLALSAGFDIKDKIIEEKLCSIGLTSKLQPVPKID